MRASVVVVSYNSAAYLPGCIESILADLGPDDELLVVDNSSTDGSAEIVGRYARVRLLRAPNNGYAGGNNLGAAHACGEYLVFLNPDTHVRRGTLDALLAPFAEASDIGMTTACVVLMRKPELINTCGNRVHYTGLAYCRGAGRSLRAYQSAEDVDAVSGAACAISRKLFLALGGFDAQFFMYVEDTDLSWRVRLAGYRCRYVPAALVAHDYRMTYSPDKAFYLDRNRHLMLLKNLRAGTYLRLLPGLVLAELLTWAFLLGKGPRYWGVKPRVYRDLWRRRNLIRAVRRTDARLRTRDRALVAGFTHRLEFGQMTGRALALASGTLLHPLFWVAHQFVGGRR